MRNEPDAVIDFPHLTELIPLSRSQIWRLEQDGLFPRRVRIGRRRVAWRLSEIEDWIASRRTKTADLSDAPNPIVME